jgi:hypothetical protein
MPQGMRTEQLEQAVQSQCPDQDTTTEADDVAGTADTADGPEYRRPSSPGTTAPAPSPVSGGGRCDMEDATAEPGGGVERGGATRPSTRERAHHTLMGGGATLRRHHAPRCGLGDTVALRDSLPTPRLTTHPVRTAGRHRLPRAVGGKRRVNGPYPGAEAPRPTRPSTPSADGGIHGARRSSPSSGTAAAEAGRWPDIAPRLKRVGQRPLGRSYDRAEAGFRVVTCDFTLRWPLSCSQNLGVLTCMKVPFFA